MIGYFRFGTEGPTGGVLEGGSKDNKVDSVDDICKHRLIQSFKTTKLIPKLSAHS